MMTINPEMDWFFKGAISQFLQWVKAKLSGKTKNKEKAADGEMLTLRDLFYQESDPPQPEHMPSREKYKK